MSKPPPQQPQEPRQPYGWPLTPIQQPVGNRGLQGGYQGSPPTGTPPPTAHERTTAAMAHGAIAFGLFGVGFLITIVVNIYFWYASRNSPYIRRQVEQAGCFQVIVMLVDFLLVAGAGVLLGYLLGAPLLGRQLLPRGSEIWFWLLLLILLISFVMFFFGTIAYGLYAASRAAQGAEFRYRIFGLRNRR